MPHQSRREERLLKVCASVSDKKQLGFKFIKVLNGIACLLLGGNDTGTMKKNKFQSKSDVIPKAALQQLRDLCKTDINTFYVAIFGKAHATRMRQH